MKFSHSLQFNTVPEWQDKYIAYSSLKKLIYNLEKQSVAQAGAGALAARDPETAGLLDHEDQYGAPDEQFKAALIKELDRITSFFQAREREVWPEVSQYLADFETARPEMEELLGASVLPSLSASSNARRRRRSLSAATTSGARPTLRNRVSSYSIDSRRRSSITFADDTADPLARTSSAPEGQNDMSHEPAEGSNATDHQNANDNGDGDGDDEDEEDDDDDDDDEDYHSGQRRGRRVSQSELESSGMQYQATMEDMATYEVLISLKKRAVAAFVALSNLNNYIELNYTGFSKALKKFDKTCGFNIRDEFMKSQVAQAHPFRKETSARINDSLEAVVASYAFIATNDDKRAATKDLNMHLREHLVFERNTVWRDMIGIERRQQAARVSATGGSGDLISFKLPLLGSLTFPGWLVSWNSILLIFNLAVFALLLSFGTLAQDEQSNCLALLVFVSLMWATEVIPLFVTSLLVPFLVVILRVVSDETGERLAAPAATKLIFSSMFTSTIMLLLGGFSLAAALSKYHIAKQLAMVVLSRAGTRPRNVLLCNMFVSMFTSMWISNVAAPVLCFSIVQPLLRTLPPGHAFGKTLIISIALASNVGGMASPIASPQNIIALQNMSPVLSWAEWFLISLPTCIISILLIWVMLLLLFRPEKECQLAQIRASRDRFTATQWLVCFVTLATIVLWCFAQKITWLIGDMGVIAILPLVVFFGSGLLTKEDFNNFLWTVIFLAMGGIALGKAVSSSGLLEVIANEIKHVTSGMNVYGILIVFSGVVLVMASFISHTVAALIILPIVAQVGSSIPDPHPRLLVMGSALMCSAAMGLPTSGFPNMTAIMQENEAGERYLSIKDFLKSGILGSILTFVTGITVSYLVMRLLGL